VKIVLEGRYDWILRGKAAACPGSITTVFNHGDSGVRLRKARRHDLHDLRVMVPAKVWGVAGEFEALEIPVRIITAFHVIEK